MEKTYGSQFQEALKCTNKEEANKWLNDEIVWHIAHYGGEKEKVKEIILNNLGYMAGYYDKETSIKINTLFGADHPIFGSPDYWDSLVMDEEDSINTYTPEKDK